MTPAAFTERLVQTYQSARRPLHRHDKLQRGESRSVASEIEDLLAFYLAENVPRIDRIRINQPLSAFISKMRKTLKPDLLIIRDGEVRAFVDLKMDLGYKRAAIAATFSTASRHLKAMRGDKVTFWEAKRAAGGIRESVPVATNAAYIFIVVTEKNTTGSTYAKVEAAARRLPLLALHTLVRGVHPNDHGLSEAELIARCGAQIATSLFPLFRQASAMLWPNPSFKRTCLRRPLKSNVRRHVTPRLPRNWSKRHASRTTSFRSHPRLRRRPRQG